MSRFHWFILFVYILRYIKDLFINFMLRYKVCCYLFNKLSLSAIMRTVSLKRSIKYIIFSEFRISRFSNNIERIEFCLKRNKFCSCFFSLFIMKRIFEGDFFLRSFESNLNFWQMINKSLFRHQNVDSQRVNPLQRTKLKSYLEIKLSWIPSFAIVWFVFVSKDFLFHDVNQMGFC